jgi:hypothetical protein
MPGAATDAEDEQPTVALADRRQTACHRIDLAGLDRLCQARGRGEIAGCVIIQHG